MLALNKIRPRFFSSIKLRNYSTPTYVNKISKDDIYIDQKKYYKVKDISHSKQARSMAVITLDVEELETKKKYQKKYKSIDKLELVPVASDNFECVIRDEDDVDPTKFVFKSPDESLTFEVPSDLIKVDQRFKNDKDLNSMEILIEYDDEEQKFISLVVKSTQILCDVVEVTDKVPSSLITKNSSAAKIKVNREGSFISAPTHTKVGDQVYLKILDATYMGKA
ncbi:elongation factor P [Acrasis kona]|uniref:Elongation factor P n=1 Tax=Acrasis kona TaxID=1008807 RepID=A0AAW2Z6X1_9EUKA